MYTYDARCSRHGDVATMRKAKGNGDALLTASDGKIVSIVDVSFDNVNRRPIMKAKRIIHVDVCEAIINNSATLVELTILKLFSYGQEPTYYCFEFLSFF